MYRTGDMAFDPHGLPITPAAPGGNNLTVTGLERGMPVDFKVCVCVCVDARGHARVCARVRCDVCLFPLSPLSPSLPLSLSLPPSLCDFHALVFVRARVYVRVRVFGTRACPCRVAWRGDLSGRWACALSYISYAV